MIIPQIRMPYRAFGILVAIPPLPKTSRSERTLVFEEEASLQHFGETENLPLVCGWTLDNER